ncbi:1854_t:CDS:1, partial [Acaulospora morrowiae]
TLAIAVSKPQMCIMGAAFAKVVEEELTVLIEIVETHPSLKS